MVDLTKSKTRRWLTASSVAALIAVSGLTGMALTSHTATAQINAQSSMPSGFADLVEAVSPAVVSISVDGEQEVRRFGNGQNFQFDFPDLPEDHPFRQFFEQFGQQFGERRGNQGPQTRHFQASGSGFVISADGFVVTNNHVVENADTVTVKFDGGEEQSATLVGTDPRTDLALLKIDGASDMPYVEFSDTDVRVGDWVVAVGNPFGLGGTVTAGIVSARGRDINPNSYGDFIQVDAAINRGNSGGPAFNVAGEVVGVNTAIFTPNGGNVGIAFAIPANTVKQVITDLMDDGSVTRGFLGVGLQGVNQNIADSLGLPDASGALVTVPTPGSPADMAGIRSGDVVIAVDDEPISDPVDLSRTISRKDPGTEVKITVWRDNQKMDFTIVLSTLEVASAEETDQMESTPSPDVPVPTSVGLVLAPNPDGTGVIIQDVEPESIADSAGFRPGDVIIEANKMELSSQEDFAAAAASVQDSGRASMLLKVERAGAVRFVGLPLS